MPIADQMVGLVAASSTIRKMFEEGLQMKREYGERNVFDFSIGNPDLPPPREFRQALRDLVNDDALNHGYMPNTGYPHVRETIAGQLSSEHGLNLSADHIIMTVGAAGALNITLKALMNPGEELLVPAPYFVGYDQYAFNAGVRVITAPTDEHFHLDLAAMERAITEKTRVVLINSPHNPTGTVYGEEELTGLGNLLASASRRLGRRIYLISDEPYNKIVYDVAAPSIFSVYPHTLLLSSFSKELSLAGERIGYLAIHPEADDAETIVSAAGVVNTMLFVNAPSLMQLAIARVPGITVDVSFYRKRRDMLCCGLEAAGYEFETPRGAFYLFPKSPLPDDVAFAGILKEEKILVTPGTGFSGPGHFRISYAVPEWAIEGAMEGFRRAIDRA
jgi:aspartate aminotransferase